MTLMTLERWSRPLPKDGAKQGKSTRRKISPLAKSRVNRKGHVVDRKDHAGRAGHESRKNEDVCVAAIGGLGNRC